MPSFHPMYAELNLQSKQALSMQKIFLSLPIVRCIDVTFQRQGYSSLSSTLNPPTPSNPA